MLRVRWVDDFHYNGLRHHGSAEIPDRRPAFVKQLTRNTGMLATLANAQPAEPCKTTSQITLGLKPLARYFNGIVDGAEDGSFRNPGFSQPDGECFRDP